MSETADCRTCVFFRGKTDEPDFFFRVCEIHRNYEVQLSLANAIKPEDRDMIGYAICDPTVTYCGRYLVNPMADGLSGMFKGIKNFFKRKPKGEAKDASEESTEENSH